MTYLSRPARIRGHSTGSCAPGRRGGLHEAEPGTFRLTPMGSCCGPTFPAWLQGIAVYLCGEEHWRAWTTSMNRLISRRAYMPLPPPEQTFYLDEELRRAERLCDVPIGTCRET
jgi:hypothetical protein